MKRRHEIWMKNPEVHDYGAAKDYLSLVTDMKTATAVANHLKRASLVRHKVKDILRASGLPLLPVDNPFVASDLKKIRKHRPISPVLLVRGDTRRGLPLIIADGYHRLCASWYTDENAPIPCRMVAHP